AGALMTDQKAHNIGVPQIGPGVNGGRDYGLAGVSHDSKDLYGFRTPPLRNVAITGPYMHNGAFTTLEEVVRHHLNPQVSLTNYTGANLPEELRPLVANDELTITDLLSTLDPKVAQPTVLTNEEIADLVTFLEALTDEAAKDLTHIPPDIVPSEVPIGYY
ncbi:MAG TPA: cytochrome-c peroxidase, partial [bacterium]|nr:cytochrome-c peroxidase [bacterium]